MNHRGLRRLVAEIDEQHHEGMRTIEDDLGELHFGGPPALVATRRQFATRLAAGGAIAFGPTLIPLAALAQDGTTSAVPPGTVSAAEPRLGDKDLNLAIFAQTVELAAVALYQGAIATGKLSKAIADVATLFAGHHQDHAGQFGAFAGRAAKPRANQKLLDELTPKLVAATTERELLELARAVEEGAAATYVYALGVLESREAAAAVSTILPVEAQHSVALSFAIDASDDAFLLGAPKHLPAFETEASSLDPKKYVVT